MRKKGPQLEAPSQRLHLHIPNSPLSLSSFLWSMVAILAVRMLVWYHVEFHSFLTGTAFRTAGQQCCCVTAAAALKFQGFHSS